MVCKLSAVVQVLFTRATCTCRMETRAQDLIDDTVDGIVPYVMTSVCLETVVHGVEVYF